MPRTARPHGRRRARPDLDRAAFLADPSLALLDAGGLAIGRYGALASATPTCRSPSQRACHAPFRTCSGAPGAARNVSWKDQSPI